MLNAIRVAVAAVLAMGIVSVASAQARKPPQSSQQSGFDTKKLFFGGGIGFNEVSGSDKGTGYQFFGGYGFGEVAKDIYVDAEVGYMDTGKMETETCQTVPFFGTVCAKGDAKAKGLWANGVARFMVAPNIELIGRAGLDFGDDDGFMFGIGAGYHVNRNMKVRFEIVERENVSSMQFNFVYTP